MSMHYKELPPFESCAVCGHFGSDVKEQEIFISPEQANTMGNPTLMGKKTLTLCPTCHNNFSEKFDDLTY